MKVIADDSSDRYPTRCRRAVACLAVLALLGAPLLAQRHAQPRSGGSSGSSSASHGSSSGSHGSSGPSSSSTAHRAPSSDRSSPHRPTGSRDGGHYGGHDGGHYYYPGRSYYPRFSLGFGYYWPYYYSPYYYSPYYYGGYYGYWGRPWGYYPPSYGYAPGGEPSYDRREQLGAIALKVKPKTAEVYVDGRFIGTAGSFDGFPGYLWLEPGVYDLALVAGGYANLEREIEITPGQVLEFKLRLEPGVATRPEARPDSRGDGRAYPGRDYPSPDRRPYPGDTSRDYPAQGEDRGREPADVDRGSGIERDSRGAELVLEVEPDDASVYLDGSFIGTAEEVSDSEEPLVVEPGSHRLQVVHPDFKTEERTVTVRPGEQRLIEVMLRPGRGV